MVIARKHLIPLGEEGTFHCLSRCVRKAYLCGTDKGSGKNYSHRKLWIKNRLKQMVKYFGIEVVGYSILDNHFHTILHICSSKAKTWSAKEVATRWLMLFPKQTQNSLHGNTSKPMEVSIDLIVSNPTRVEVLRERLISISWFMAYLKENIARRANSEDQCTGRFWEGRFKSTALLNEAAVLACLQYVDLNPIRANIAKSPEQSNFTSGQDRIVGHQARKRLNRVGSEGKETKNTVNRMASEQVQMIIDAKREMQRDSWLVPLKRRITVHEKCLVNLDLDEYLKLLDWTGRQLKDGKKGSIPVEFKPILHRLDIETEEWLNTVNGFGSLFFRAAGSVRALIKAANQVGNKWLKGKTNAQTSFS